MVVIVPGKHLMRLQNVLCEESQISTGLEGHHLLSVVQRMCEFPVSGVEHMKPLLPTN